MSQGFYISYTIEGEQQLSRKLLLVASRVKDWTPAFEQTAMTLKQLFSEEVFDTQGGAIDEHWAPLSPSYALQKEKKYPGKGLLEATGDMKGGFMSTVRPDMAKVWNKMDYFKYHQSNKPRQKLPRRVMMKLGNAQREQVVKIFHSYFQEVIEKG